MDKAAVGQNIAKHRKGKNITQAGLADQLGVSRSAVSNWERGKTSPDKQTMEKVATILEMDNGKEKEVTTKTNTTTKKTKTGSETKSVTTASDKPLVKEETETKITEKDGNKVTVKEQAEGFSWVLALAVGIVVAILLAIIMKEFLWPIVIGIVIFLIMGLSSHVTIKKIYKD